MRSLLTFNAVWTTCGLRGDRMALLSIRPFTAAHRPLKSVGGAWVRVPTYSTQEKALGM